MTNDTQTTERLHYVTVKPADDSHPEPQQQFECRGDKTSPCHQYPNCDCESWSKGHEHPYVPHDECWMQGWFENEGGTVYEGEEYDEYNIQGLPSDMDRSGPIVASFQQEFVGWDFSA